MLNITLLDYIRYKQFFKQFKSKEKDGLVSAKDFAEQNMKQLPVKVHWKVYLELADLAKRENSLKLARKFYRKVIQLQPYPQLCIAL